MSIEMPENLALNVLSTCGSTDDATDGVEAKVSVPLLRSNRTQLICEHECFELLQSWFHYFKLAVAFISRSYMKYFMG